MQQGSNALGIVGKASAMAKRPRDPLSRLDQVIEDMLSLYQEADALIDEYIEKDRTRANHSTKMVRALTLLRERLR
jgi:hypothetical protein